MIFFFVRETKQLTLEEIDREALRFLVWLTLTFQRSSPSRLASTSRTRPRSGCRTSSSDTSSGSESRSRLRSLPWPTRPTAMSPHPDTRRLRFGGSQIVVLRSNGSLRADPVLVTFSLSLHYGCQIVDSAVLVSLRAHGGVCHEKPSSVTTSVPSKALSKDHVMSAT